MGFKLFKIVSQKYIICSYKSKFKKSSIRQRRFSDHPFSYSITTFFTTFACSLFVTIEIENTPNYSQ